MVAKMEIKKVAMFSMALICLMAVDASADDDLFTIPTAGITIDGNFDDWNGVPAVFQDTLGDIYGVTHIDIEKAYIAKDKERLYFRFDLAEDLEKAEYPCTGLPGFKVVFNFQSPTTTNSIKISADFDSSLKGSANIWSSNPGANTMTYPPDADFVALIRKPY